MVLGGPGRSWDVVGQSWEVLGWSWQVLEGPGTVLRGSWASLGTVLGVLWAVLEASWGATWTVLVVFGCLGGVMGRLVGVLGASWGALARKRWPTWLQLGPQNEARIEKKSKLKSIKILMALGVGFLKDFGGFGRVKWSQVGTKIEPKIHVNIEMRF